jgi:hypothetical protein
MINELREPAGEVNLGDRDCHSVERGVSPGALLELAQAALKP